MTTQEIDFRLPTGARCAVLTPLGRGAIGTVGVRGTGAIELVARRFTPASGRPLSAHGIGQTVFGRFRNDSAAAEELVVGLLAADEVEIHCHGGVAAVQAIVAALAAEGCAHEAEAAWPLFAHDDALATAAVTQLAAARTERTAAILLDQYRGALWRERNAIRGHVAAGDWPAAQRTVRVLLERADVGLHLARPWRIVLAGRPNAGKSSLLNALVGYQRAIVFEQPGTTRDVLTAVTALDGWPVELADTAGLRSADDPLEAEGVARARQEASRADGVLLVIDLSAPWDDSVYRELASAAPRLLVVHNKADLAPAAAARRPPGVAVSALSGAGLAELGSHIASLLVPHPPPPGAAVPFLPEHVEALERIAAAAEKKDAGAAEAGLDTLGGPTSAVAARR